MTVARPAPVVAPPTPRAVVPELDGLRGVAIVLVFLTHFVAAYLVGAHGVDGAVYAVTRAGWTGVDLFFVLSGFLITGILLDTKGGEHCWRNFAAKRVLRIFPLYFGALFVAFVLVPMLRWDEPQYATLRAGQLWYWTYLVNVLEVVRGPAATPLNTSHLWSLCIEEQFYLLWPMVVLFASRRRLPQVAGWTIAAGVPLRFLLAREAGPIAAYVLTPGRLDGLMVGGIIAVAAREAGGLEGWRDAAARVLPAGLVALIGLGAWRGMSYEDGVVAVLGFPLLALVYGAALVLALTSDGPWTRALRSPPLRAWGKYSYGLYVLHYPLLWALDDKVGRRLASPRLVVAGSHLPSVLLRGAIGVPLAFGLAWLSYQLYERRFLELKRHFA